MRTVKKLFAVILTAAMVFALVPAVMAVEFKVSAPTPERVWCVTQDMECDSDMDLMYRGYEYLTIPGQPDDDLLLSTYIKSDGTFTDAMMAKLREEIMNSMIDDDMMAGVFDGMELPENIYDYLRFEFEVVVRGMKYLAEYPEYEEFGFSEYINAFLTDYPDGETMYDEVMEIYFDGNEKPSVPEMIEYMCGDQIVVSPHNRYGEYTIAVYRDEYIEDDDRWFVNIADIVAPNGAIYDTSLTKGKPMNVYMIAEAMIENGWMADPYFSLTLLTGYTFDRDGYMYTRMPEYVYALDAEGNRTKDFNSLVDEDGYVIGKEISLRDMAVESLVELYTVIYGGGSYEDYITEVPEVDYGDHDRYLEGLLYKYFNVEEEYPDEEPPMTEEEIRAMAEEEIDLYISEMEKYGEAEFITEMLFEICDYSTDNYGYIYEDMVYGYVTDEDGNRLKGSDVMDGDGTILVGEYAGRNVAEILKGYMAEADTTALLKGDATGDGKINLTDASTMMKAIAGWDGVEADATASDANGDGNVNLSDVSLMMQYIAGWDVVFGY